MKNKAETVRRDVARMDEEAESPFMLNPVEGLRLQADEKRHQQTIERYAEYRRKARRDVAYWDRAIRDEKEQQAQILAALAAKTKGKAK